ncbi:Cytochrome P450 93A2 [Acorus calamus]|uniref:Cytochrome P450 93A2 n=1 Tax=Acorus calamus TaxID=4465 RepID=A0AAV9DWL3_ACOCL|nr:Cytochrome P450 93A2 [Acorus calamus]
MGWFDGMFDAIIEGRLRVIRGNKREGASGDFLDTLLRTMERGSSEVELTMDHIKGLLLDLLVGGSDTTSITMEWAMAELMHNPDKMKKAQDELHNVVGDDNIVEETHLPKLKFLDAVIKETLRLHPVTPLLIPRSPSKACIVGGHTVPKGARVFINVWAIHRDSSMWENPLKFEPERFLVGADIGKGDFRGSNYGYAPFGSGRRMCLGISLAERILMYMMASLLHSFEWQVPDGVGEVELEEKMDIVLRKAKPLVTVPVPRLSDAKLYT